MDAYRDFSSDEHESDIFCKPIKPYRFEPDVSVTEDASDSREQVGEGMDGIRDNHRATWEHRLN